MAFRAPRAPQQLQRPLAPRQQTARSSNVSASILTPASEEEWVLFSPSSVATQTTHRLTHGSEVASLISHPRNGVIIPGSFNTGDGHDFSELDDEEDSELEDDETYGGTDSLQAFQDAGHVGMLPTHNGLGMFSSTPGERSLEESLRLVAASSTTLADTNSRIERWRIEQSQAFLTEIERHTRKRRLSEASRAGNLTAAALEAAQAAEAKHEEDVASMSAKSDATVAPGDVAHESFWKRITRSFIRDIIGIDDSLLEVIFGETLPAEAVEEEMKAHQREVEQKLLDRIAKELGELMHLYSHTPTYTRNRSLSRTPTLSSIPRPIPQEPRSPAHSLQITRTDPATSNPGIPQYNFTPTLTAAREENPTALWGIEEEPDTLVDAQLQKEYWEQDLDMHLVFSFIKSRFYGSSSTPAPPRSTPSTANSTPAPPSVAHSFRHHHPLINKRSYSARRRGSTCGVQEGRISRTGSVSTKSKGYYWDVATSVASGKSGSCVQGVWAAI